MMEPKQRHILLVGGKGMLARAVSQKAPIGCSIKAVDLPEFDMTDRNKVLSLCKEFRPDIIINCAAYTNVDGCESEQKLANKVNGVAVGGLAKAAKMVDATLVHVSTDYIFDGEKSTPYREDDRPNPQSAYGSSKLLGEQELLASGLVKFFIVRTSWLYGPGGNNFVETILRLAAERDELRIVADQVGSPTYTGDLAEAIVNLVNLAVSPRSPASTPYGIYHFSGAGQCSWYEFAKEIISVAKAAGLELKVKEIAPIRTDEYPLPAKRPAYSVFDKSKYQKTTGKDIPLWQDSLKEYFRVRNIS